jgi:hypothetical protein
MATVSPAVVRTADELTPDWLADVLGSGAIASLAIAPIGTGQMSLSYRVEPTYADGAAGGPASVVVKLAAEDPTSRATGIGLGAYAREISFYRELAPRIGGPLPVCHLAVIDAEEGWFTLVLEEVVDAVQGDQIAGCDVAQARLAVEALAALQAPVLGDVGVGSADWLNVPSPLTQGLVTQLLPGFFERYEDRIAPEHRALVERFVPSIDGWEADRRPPLGLVHGDYRLDNMLFAREGGAAPRPLTTVDWQTVSFGPLMLDISYFLGASLTTEDRRAHEEELVRAYHAALLARGARDLDWDTCWSEYRRASFYGVLMAVAASMLVVRTDRGDEMFMTSLARHAQQAIDLDAVELLPAPGEGRPPALVPPPEDEGKHAPGGERLWNESWYFDAISEDGTLGAYVRIGLYPNLGVAWYTAFVCGPGRPTVAMVDFGAPLPDGSSLAIDRDGLRADHVCEAPLERFRVTFAGTGRSHRDAAAILRDEPGEPVDVELDLVWETAGVPYAYRLTTRYEIPCDAHGTIRIGDEQLELRGPGQRDHSWGTRDWWSMDWVWSAGRLDDGTRVHAVSLDIPDTPALSVGYVQDGGDVIELDAVKASEERSPDGLVASARIEVDRGVPGLDMEPLAFGPLRLSDEDGRTTVFPRAMCRLRADDGRTGLAWVEWNRNERPSTR